MVERKNRERIARSKGSQPVVFENETVDALASMVLSLMGEVVVLKDRLDANERLLAAAGLHGPADVDGFAPDAAAKAYRAGYREGIYDRVLGAGRDKLVPQALAEQQEYEGVLDAVTRD
ncbi:MULTISPECIES: hypothetical protein [Novosphingobium]|uniref:Uncharacterized protein n=1 Tax=Novosphingobium mangrovi (ex Hu et al. 2023) TaxID=2930094 RepID=A0ABT0AFA5_9SPHN|nr:MULTISPECIES: hypothetical protein [Novosphingobium]MCJ1961891.1 hypothetical protein [Novosphingobium mangrovi (ex Hu et al. 2023)]